MIKKIKNNKLFIIFYIFLFLSEFSSQFFVSNIDQNIKFGKKGTNFFLVKYNKTQELTNYLDELYLELKNLSNKELCKKLVYETYEIKKPIKTALFPPNLSATNPNKGENIPQKII